MLRNGLCYGLLILAFGCRTTGPHTAPVSVPSVLFVSTAGADANEGRRERPFRTLEHALRHTEVTEIVVMPGRYRLNNAIVQRKGLKIRGKNATLVGNLSIEADDTQLESLNIEGTIRVRRAARVRFEKLVAGAPKSAEARSTNANANAKAETRDDDRPSSGASIKHALEVEASDVELTESVLNCGRRTCLLATTSTLALTRVDLNAQPNTARGLRIAQSEASLETVTLKNTTIAQVVAEHSARITIRDSRFTSAEGSGVVVVDGSSIKLRRTDILSATRSALILQDANARIDHIRASAKSGPTIGIAGGETLIAHAEIDGTPVGAVSVIRRQDKGRVRIVGGKIMHLRHPGVTIASGDVTIQGTVFVGDATATSDGGEGVLAQGLDTRVNIDAVFEAPTSFGVSINQDATGTVSATVTAPRLGAVMVDSATTERVYIKDLKATDCKQGSGVVVMDSSAVAISHAEIKGCSEAGVLAGTGSDVTISGSKFLGNREYGVAAFGGSRIHLDDTVIQGSRWATFSTCIDGARVDDGQANRLLGPTMDCP